MGSVAMQRNCASLFGTVSDSWFIEHGGRNMGSDLAAWFMAYRSIELRNVIAFGETENDTQKRERMENEYIIWSCANSLQLDTQKDNGFGP